MFRRPCINIFDQLEYKIRQLFLSPKWMSLKKIFVCIYQGFIIWINFCTCRKERFDEFLKSLTDNKDAMQHWKEWGLKFANQTLKVKGQAHDLFSRIFKIRIYELFLPNVIFVMICSKLRKKSAFFDPLSIVSDASTPSNGGK